MKLLGEYLKESANVSSAGLVEALRYQVDTKDKGNPIQLGEILVNLGLASKEDVATALERQSRERGTPIGKPGMTTTSLWISRTPRSE